MFESLEKNIRQQITISRQDMDKILSSIKVRQVRKKKNLLSQGDSSGCMFYLNEGLFRHYIYNEDGGELTIDLVARNNWFGDAKAFLAQEPASINIEALEDSEVFCLGYDDLQRFYDEIPLFERAVRKTLEYYFVKAIDRANKMNRAGFSAQDRYLHFVRSHPKLENRVPAIYLASYLGLAPETLSRLRHQGTRQATA
jgi:CRP-like cAMP-binding protein